MARTNSSHSSCFDAKAGETSETVRTEIQQLLKSLEKAYTKDADQPMVQMQEAYSRFLERVIYLLMIILIYLRQTMIMNAFSIRLKRCIAVRLGSAAGANIFCETMNWLY